MFSTVFQDYQQYSFKLADYVSSGSVQSPENLLKIKKSAIMTAADQFIEKTPQGWASNLTTRFDKNGLEKPQLVFLNDTYVFNKEKEIMLFCILAEKELTNILNRVAKIGCCKSFLFRCTNIDI